MSEMMVQIKKLQVNGWPMCDCLFRLLPPSRFQDPDKLNREAAASVSLQLRARLREHTRQHIITCPLPTVKRWKERQRHAECERARRSTYGELRSQLTENDELRRDRICRGISAGAR